MRDEYERTTADENSCPFCASNEGCEHFLLVVDLTFQTCDGGALFEAFVDRWSRIFDREDENLNKTFIFTDLLKEVDFLSDASSEYVFEGGPGMTSEYGMYFCSTRERVETAVKRFEAASATTGDLE